MSNETVTIKGKTYNKSDVALVKASIVVGVLGVTTLFLRHRFNIKLEKAVILAEEDAVQKWINTSARVGMHIYVLTDEMIDFLNEISGNVLPTAKAAS